ncbi:MAG: glutathione S-transferase family protein [Rhizobiales bacterium]|nr:glutathione S-transferase family protein [Hyphomicrobiales bacterium]
MLTFYHSGGMSCAVATHIALEEAGANYKDVKVDLAAGEQRKPEFLKINPKGRVPVLVTDKGILTETVALLLYVAQTHPAAKLAPTDPFELARLQAFNAYLASTVHVAHAHKLRGYRWSDDAAAVESMKAKVAANMTDCATIIENEYLAGPWVMGDQFTVADPYLHIITLWMVGDGVDLSRFPKLSAHKAAMEQRPAVKKAMARLS